jgi:hypothetical protein
MEVEAEPGKTECEHKVVNEILRGQSCCVPRKANERLSRSFVQGYKKKTFTKAKGNARGGGP